MMNLKSFTAAIVLGLITLGGTAQAQDKVTERPNVKVGDRWVFVRSTSGAKLEYPDIAQPILLCRIVQHHREDVISVWSSAVGEPPISWHRPDP
jgi:hypothetical protein